MRLSFLAVAVLAAAIAFAALKPTLIDSVHAISAALDHLGAPADR